MKKYNNNNTINRIRGNVWPSITAINIIPSLEKIKCWVSSDESANMRQDTPSENIGIPKLSICVPTCNFGKSIGETLESIIAQATNEVEIVIVDGASTDNTLEIVGDYAPRFPRLNYHRLERKGGIDRDMAKSVELASRKYCWLFSADDIMKENALPKILKEVEQGHDLYLCGLTHCDFYMRPIEEHPVPDAPACAEFELRNVKDRAEYFTKAKTTTAFFSFCGSLIFKKSRWDEIPIDEEFVGNCWEHVTRIFRMIPGGLCIKYLQESLLYKREDNDSFSDIRLVTG